jgi:hypothetical protein
MKKIIIISLAILITSFIFYLMSIMAPFLVEYITNFLSGENNG